MAEGKQDTATPTVEDPPRLLKRVHDRLHRNRVTGLATKVVITVVGVAIIAVGVFLSGPGIPGPGFLIILGGLAVLATEYDWARRALEWAKERYENAKERVENMDPAVRRRRALLTLTAVVLVAGAATAYVVLYDWPGFAVTSWDWVQGLNGAVPELPGM